MNISEKAEKFDIIQKCRWGAALDGNLLVSSVAAALIRTCGIEGPNGESPEEA
jgi:hypothetical protein